MNFYCVVILNSLFNGNIGFNLTGIDEELIMYGGVPTFNGYVGFGENGSNVKDLIHSFSEEDEVEDLGSGLYKKDEAIAQVTNQELIVHSNDSVKERFNVEPITKVEGMNDFGAEPLSIYIDMTKISSMETAGSPQAEALIALATYMTVNANAEGVELKLMMKNKNENVLKQMVQTTAEQFKSQISQISL